MTLGAADTDVGARFLGGCLASVRERTDRLQEVIVDPGRALGADTHDKDVLVLPSLPQLPLLERVDAVTCHASHNNTMCEALWHAVPSSWLPSAMTNRSWPDR